MGVIITLVGTGIVIGISYIVDASGTTTKVISFITIRGVTWICKKAVETMNKENAQIINFTGWVLASLNAVGILKNCKKGITPIIKDIGECFDILKKFKNDLDGISGDLADFLEKLTFWN